MSAGAGLSIQDGTPAAVVEHDGQPRLLADLMRCLGPRHLREIEASLPRTAQATWDEVVRRWPALAAEIVASV